MGGGSLERLARRCGGRVRRPDLLSCRHPGRRGHGEAPGRGSRALRTARETAVFIRRNDDFLLFHRAVDKYWHVVAGVVEDGETFPGAAARELREETGLDAALLDLGMPQRYRVPEEMRDEYAPGVGEVAIENFAVAVPAGWEPILNEEHDEYRWVSLADAIALAHWPETAAVLAAIARPKISS
ncbi:MAG: NUDIX domain-containing protein [Chloroflexi bacterium]|nr:MAG: NUDIX domain-containing protein [Chloroflexota bacterium]